MVQMQQYVHVLYFFASLLVVEICFVVNAILRLFLFVYLVIFLASLKNANVTFVLKLPITYCTDLYTNQHQQ